MRSEGLWPVPSSVLATPTDELTTRAERTRSLVDEAARLRSVLGERPRIDFAAERDAMAEWQALQDDRRAAVVAREDRLRTATWANAAGVGWLGAGITLAVVARQPMGPSIDLAIALAATSPVAGCVAGWVKARRARASVVARRTSCAEALERAGAKTMGELRARRIVADSWTRRRDALRVAEKQASDALAAWHELVGPDFAPSDVATLLERCEELRRELLDQIKSVLDHHLEQQTVAAKVILPFPELPKELLPGGRVSAGLERLQGLKLRLWRTA